MKLHYLWLGTLGLLFSLSCAVGTPTTGYEKESGNGKSVVLSVVNWNVQTFFDAETEGSEYSEFVNSGRWSKDKYVVRLHRLCEVITSLNADVYVFEEIENESVLYDISNQLAGHSWDSSKNWNYGCFVRESNSSIGCAVLSKYELGSVKSHGMDIRTQKDSQPSVRSILEVTVLAGGKELVMFVNHWKSKLGGEEESEIWRDWQEFILSNCVYDVGDVNVVNEDSSLRGLICVGDFNRSAEDFVTFFESETCVNKNTILRGFNEVLVWNPWFCGDGSFVSETGSYFYNDSWERIDNFLSAGKCKLTAFSPKTNGNWVNGKGTPNGYKIFTGEGYSDHLPIMCTVIM